MAVSRLSDCNETFLSEYQPSQGSESWRKSVRRCNLRDYARAWIRQRWIPAVDALQAALEVLGVDPDELLDAEWRGNEITRKRNEYIAGQFRRLFRDREKESVIARDVHAPAPPRIAPDRSGTGCLRVPRRWTDRRVWRDHGGPPRSVP